MYDLFNLRRTKDLAYRPPEFTRTTDEKKTVKRTYSEEIDSEVQQFLPRLLLLSIHNISTAICECTMKFQSILTDHKYKCDRVKRISNETPLHIFGMQPN